MSGLAAMFVVTMIATVVGTVLALEVQTWAPYLASRLLREAFARFPDDLPADMRARWMEEIEADVAAFDDRPLGGLAFAFRLWRKGGRELAGELALRQVREAQAQARPEPSAEVPEPQPSTEPHLYNGYTLHVHHWRQWSDKTVDQDQKAGLWIPLATPEKGEDDE